MKEILGVYANQIGLGKAAWDAASAEMGLSPEDFERPFLMNEERCEIVGASNEMVLFVKESSTLLFDCKPEIIKKQLQSNKFRRNV